MGKRCNGTWMCIGLLIIANFWNCFIPLVTAVIPTTSTFCLHDRFGISIQSSISSFASVTLKDPSCVASSNATHITLSTPFSDCGSNITETSSQIIFWNEAIMIGASSSGVITRARETRFRFTCRYSKWKWISINAYKPKDTPQSNPPEFVTHPQEYSLNLGQIALFSCTYFNYTESTFYWMKDGNKLNHSGLTSTRQRRDTTAVKQGTITEQKLSVVASEPKIQGFYTCVVEDNLGHVVQSKKGYVRLKDVATTKMALTINRIFEAALLNEMSPQYLAFKKEVIDTLNITLIKKGMRGKKSFELRNIRSGSVLVDVYVYFLGLNNSARSDLCSNVGTVSPQDGSSSLQITSLNITTLDCCGPSQTGEVQLKGVITWSSIVADNNSTIVCPYMINDTVVRHAVRLCKSDFVRGPQWRKPNINECPYKTITTRRLEKLSETTINNSNAEKVSEQLDEITKDPEKITNRKDVQFTADAIVSLVKITDRLKQTTENILNATSNLLNVDTKTVVESQTNSNSSRRLLDAIQTLANNIPIQKNETVIVVKENIAMGIISVDPKECPGLVIQAAKGQSNVSNIALSESASYDTARQDIATIFLSGLLLRKANNGTTNNGTTVDGQRITTFIFDNENLFLTSLKNIDNSTNKADSVKFVNSKILSAAIKGVKLTNLVDREQVRSTFSALMPAKGKTECVYWDFDGSGGKSSWSSWGCWPDENNDQTQTNNHRCRCNHLTNFAILLDVGGEVTLPKEAQFALSMITYVGCGISLVALTFTLVTFSVFRNLRKNRPQKILMQLCFALIALIITLLVGFQATKKSECQAASLLIHYFVLASFFWMAVEGVNIYLCIVKIIGGDVPKFLMKASVFAWGLPAVIVTITAAATKLEYHATQRGNDWICMVNGVPFYVSYLAPILVIVAGNLIVLGMVLRTVFKKSDLRKDKHMDVATKARIAAACSVLMGITWIFGIFAVEELRMTFQIIFCILNSLQGFFVFVFYCARNKEVRREWKHCFGFGPESVGSSSGTQRTKYTTYRNRLSTDTSLASKRSPTDSVALSGINRSPRLVSFQKDEAIDNPCYMSNSHLKDGVGSSLGTQRTKSTTYRNRLSTDMSRGRKGSLSDSIALSSINRSTTAEGLVSPQKEKSVDNPYYMSNTESTAVTYLDSKTQPLSSMDCEQIPKETDTPYYWSIPESTRRITLNKRDPRNMHVEFVSTE